MAIINVNPSAEVKTGFETVSNPDFLKIEIQIKTGFQISNPV